jgi:anti-sigma regulatory factor (Ser/Thr protein kinase)
LGRGDEQAVGRQTRSTFSAAPASARQARDWARSVLSGWDLDVTAPDTLLILTELMANAVRHGRGPVEVVLSRQPDGVRVEVADTGPGRVRAASASTNPGTSGRGLLIVDALSSGWGVRYGRAHKVVWADVDA